MLATFMLLLPVFGIVTFGYLLKKYSFIKPAWIKKLNTFIYYLSLPALIITLFSNIEFTESTLSFLGFHAILVVILNILLIAVLSLFAINNSTKVAVILGAMIGNTVYMGYPILSATYPTFPIEIGMGAGTVQLIIGLLIGIFLIEYLVLKTKKLSVYLFDLALNPLIIAVFISVLFRFLPYDQITNTIFYLISLLGKTASPLALFSLGIFMHRKLSKESWLLGGFAIVTKLVLLPIAVFLVSLLFGFNKEFLQISVLISAMPTAVTGFILAQKYNLNKNLSADIILVSTILSAITIPLTVLLLG